MDEKGVCDWVLGIVDGLVDNESTRITHMVSTKANIKWTFPEEAEIGLVDHEQIICWNMAVTYCRTAKICCTIKKQLENKLNSEVANLKN